MRIITYSYAKNHFKQVIDQAVSDACVTVISRRDGDDAVLMSLETYNSMVETMHLLRSPANVRHLARSIQQYR